MVKKIKKLTAAQQKALVAYCDEWLRIGRCTEPSDRPAAEAVWKEMYVAIGEEPPYIWWCDGPAVGSIVRTVLKSANLGDNLRANLGANLWTNLGANLWTNLEANLWTNLEDNLVANLWTNLRANLGDNLGDNLGWSFLGSHESAWSAFYNWTHEALRPMHDREQSKKLSWWLTLARSTGWWHCHKGIVFACERPAKQQVDDRGRLHCTDGPALLCRDGWPVHAIHGIRVPSDIIEQPTSLTLARINTEKNAEVRRVMIERFGFDRYLRDGQIQEVQRDDFGRLYRKQVGTEPAMQFVRVVNSTPEPDGTCKEYVLPVRNTVRTAHEAVASSFGLDTATYNPSFQS